MYRVGVLPVILQVAMRVALREWFGSPESSAIGSIHRILTPAKHKRCDFRLWLRKIRACRSRLQQWLALTEENRRQREMHGVDQPLALYMLGAGVPSDHLVTPTRKTDSGGKDLSCG
jgi:hypothetical protein